MFMIVYTSALRGSNSLHTLADGDQRVSRIYIVLGISYIALEWADIWYKYI